MQPRQFHLDRDFLILDSLFMTWRKCRGSRVGKYIECIYDVAQIPGVGVGWEVYRMYL